MNSDQDIAKASAARERLLPELPFRKIVEQTQHGLGLDSFSLQPAMQVSCW
jgi:hypothetical protein